MAEPELYLGNRKDAFKEKISEVLRLGNLKHHHIEKMDRR